MRETQNGDLPSGFHAKPAEKIYAKNARELTNEIKFSGQFKFVAVDFILSFYLNGVVTIHQKRDRTMKQKIENQLSHRIIGTAIQLHRELGPGLLESAYEHALVYNLCRQGLSIQQQFPVPFIYDEIKLEAGYRIDILVNNRVLIEIKSVEALAPVHFAQTLTYLKLANLKLGLLINFNVKVLKNGIHRVVNNL